MSTPTCRPLTPNNGNIFVTLVITFSCISFCYLCFTVTLSFSSSRVPAVMPFLVSRWWQHTLKGRCGGDHTRLVTDLRKDQIAVTM